MKYNAEIKEVNTDRGTQFYSTKKNPSTFEAYVKSQGMKFIPSRRNNPQTNGKLERLWYEYDKHRFSFESILEKAFSRIFVGFVYENEWVVI